MLGPVLPINESTVPPGTLAVTWKNMREQTQFCYPPVEHGTKPAFMTIYSNRAKPTGSSLERHAAAYDPRYTLIEIGADDSLNGRQVTLTLRAGLVGECCIDFDFHGTEEGTHYTLQELLEDDKIANRSKACLGEDGPWGSSATGGG